MPPNAALPPARENGVDATFVPNTDALAGAPNAAKSVTTLRGGECEGVGIVLVVDVDDDGERGLRVGRYGAYG